LGSLTLYALCTAGNALMDKPSLCDVTRAAWEYSMPNEAPVFIFLHFVSSQDAKESYEMWLHQCCTCTLAFAQISISLKLLPKSGMSVEILWAFPSPGKVTTVRTRPVHQLALPVDMPVSCAMPTMGEQADPIFESTVWPLGGWRWGVHCYSHNKGIWYLLAKWTNVRASSVVRLWSVLGIGLKTITVKLN